MLKKWIKSFVTGPLLEQYEELQRQRRLNDVGRILLRQNGQGSLSNDPGTTASIDASLRWLAMAQDKSATRDGGFARHYSALNGWGRSYPETTGYIILTLIDCGIATEELSY